MTGQINGLTVTIDTHQSNDTTFTRYRVRYPSLGLGLQAKRQHGLARVGKLLGFQDIEVGDPVFDEAIIVKGDYPERVASFLTPSRRVAITGLIELYPGSKITDTEIAYSKRGLDSDYRQLISTMQRILSVAQELRAIDRPNREAADRRLAGDVGEALEILEQAAPSGDPFIDFARKQQMGEIRYAQGDRAGRPGGLRGTGDADPRRPGGGPVGKARSARIPRHRPHPSRPMGLSRPERPPWWPNTSSAKRTTASTRWRYSRTSTRGNRLHGRAS